MTAIAYSQSDSPVLALGLGRSLAKRAIEVRVSISLLRAGISHNPQAYPACHLPMLFGATRVRDLVIDIVSLRKILQNRTTFPDFQLFAISAHINKGWDATVGIDVEVPLFFLLMFKKFDRAYL